MYKFTLAKPIDGIASIEFPRLTWARYKQMMMKVQAAVSVDDADRPTTVEAVTTAMLEIGTPVLTDTQLEKLTVNDVDQLGELYSEMETRGGEWNGGQFKLTTPIPVQVKSSDANVTGFTFKAQTVSGAWDYLAEPDTLRQYEMFIQKFGRHVGDNSEVKELPLNKIWLDMMDAKDVLFIGKSIAGKSQGGSASWVKL